MKILIAAGSSGGHIFPAIATADKLKELSNLNEILFVGSKKNIDKEIFENGGYEYCTLSSSNKIFRDLALSFAILRKFKPDLAIGFGGYVSFPMLLMARILGIPTMVHEQNLFPGLANRILSNFVNRIAVSFKETNKFFLRKSIVVETGNPIRLNLVRLDRRKALDRFGLDERKFTILVMGGSQGAHFINEVILETLKNMNKSQRGQLQIVHLTGMGDFEFVKKEYEDIEVESRVFSFFDMMSQAYSVCDLVISRAGATSVAELAFFGKPALLIPYPSVKVHQIENARFLEKKGAAIVIEQTRLSKELLKNIIFDLINNYEKLKSMCECSTALAKPDAAERLAREILNAVKS